MSIYCSKCGSSWGHVGLHGDYYFCNICKHQWDNRIAKIEEDAKELINFVESDIIDDIGVKQIIKPKNKAKAKGK